MVKATQDYSKTIVNYDPLTGNFYWKVIKPGVSAGTLAGSIDKDGYRVIRIDRKLYRAHHIAWLIVHGQWPYHELDHINRIRSDNRISNLRLATRAQNGRNLSLSCVNTSGILGVTFDKERNKWSAQIKVNGKNINLGRFINLADAAACREAAEQKYFGEFAAKKSNER